MFRFKAVLAAAFAAVSIVSPLSHAAATWQVQYHADTAQLPENTGDGWAYYTAGSEYTRTLVNNTLNMNTMNGSPYYGEDWENSTGTFDFKSGFVLETRLQLISETNLYDRWGGASIEAEGTDRSIFDIQVATGKVILGSIFDSVSYSMDTSAYHVYRVDVNDDYARLFVDGTFRLGMPLEPNNVQPYVIFGDNGWEGGDVNYAYVRYGVPEPTSLALLSVGTAAGVLRRRRNRSSETC